MRPRTELPRPITLRGGAIRPGVVFAGVIVPGTDGLLAADERDKEDWRVTHVPTMSAIWKADYMDADTLEQAIGLAQRFYREATIRGWDLNSKNQMDVVEKHNTMTEAEKLTFWRAVRGDMKGDGA